jgi:hypothetical protein
VQGTRPKQTSPLSTLPPRDHHASLATPPLSAPLNDREALLFFIYERWRGSWWNIDPPYGMYAWQTPYDAMAHPWHWDRYTMFSGLTVFTGAIMEFWSRGKLGLFLSHLTLSAAFPVTAARIHNPETRGT